MHFRRPSYESGAFSALGILQAAQGFTVFTLHQGKEAMTTNAKKDIIASGKVDVDICGVKGGVMQIFKKQV